MTVNIDDSARLIWLHGFMSAAAHGSYKAAGEELGISATTVERQVAPLEAWLNAPLFYPNYRLSLTEYGDKFVPVAWQVIGLLKEGDLGVYLSETRVLPDGRVTVQGEPLNTDAAREIGRLLIGSRYKEHPWAFLDRKVHGRDIDIDAILAAQSDKSE